MTSIKQVSCASTFFNICEDRMSELQLDMLQKEKALNKLQEGYSTIESENNRNAKQLESVQSVTI
jgi:hypothetical protein